MERYTLVVEGVKVVEALDRTVVFAVVRGMGGRDSHVMTGTAEVHESAERRRCLQYWMQRTAGWKPGGRREIVAHAVAGET